MKSASPPKFPALLNCTCSFAPAAVALIVIVSVPDVAVIEMLLPFSNVNVSSEASAITLPPEGDIAIVLNASFTDPPPPPPEPVYEIVITSPFNEVVMSVPPWIVSVSVAVLAVVVAAPST